MPDLTPRFTVNELVHNAVNQGATKGNPDVCDKYIEATNRLESEVIALIEGQQERMLQLESALRVIMALAGSYSETHADTLAWREIYIRAQRALKGE